MLLALCACLWTAAAGAAEDDVARGAYLATVADCVACHTEPGKAPFAGGEPMETLVGSIYPPNITPDRKTGLGLWSEEAFRRALWEGIGRNGEHLYPAFPYTEFTRLSARDVHDIWVYLRTVPAVERPTPPNTLIFPFNIRGLIWIWDALFLDDRRFQPDSSRPALWNRGAYLVTALAHCGECHTPRNLFMAQESGHAMAGSAFSGWYAPNISPSKSEGIGNWSDAEIKAFLHTGATPRHGIAGGMMAQAVLDSLSKLTDSDLDAIVAYLRALPPQKDAPEHAARPSTLPTPYARPGTTSAGLMLYRGLCARCHGPDGMGLDGKYPAIALDRTVTGESALDLAAIIVNGADPARQTGMRRMPAFGHALNDEQTALLVDAMLEKFHGRAPDLVAAEIEPLRHTANGGAP